MNTENLSISLTIQFHIQLPSKEKPDCPRFLPLGAFRSLSLLGRASSKEDDAAL